MPTPRPICATYLSPIPDLLPRRGTVVVSYSQNNTDLSAVQDDPRIYRPRFLRVSLRR